MQNKFTVLTEIKNEPLRILPLIENFKGFAKVIVLLDFEDLETEKILIQKKIKYIKRPKNYFAQSQPKRVAWLLAQSPTDYILFALASFYVPVKLLRVFDKVASDSFFDGVFHSNYYWSHGKIVQRPWIRKQSSACYFFNRKKINIKLSKIHNEFPINKSNCLILPPVKDLSLQIFRDDDMSVITLKEVAYAEREAIERKNNRDKPVTSFFLITRLIQSFTSGYIRQGGYRSGIEGLIFHINHAIQIFLVYSRLWEIQNKKTFHENRVFHVNIRRKLIAQDKKNKHI